LGISGIFLTHLSHIRIFSSIGKFKIETEDKKHNKNADNILTEYVGLRAKNYKMKLEVDDN